MSKPRFINRQRGAVTVTSPSGKLVRVQPFQELGRFSDGVYVLEGEYWSRFVQEGMLEPFPGRVQKAAPVLVQFEDGSRERVDLLARLVEEAEAQEEGEPPKEAALMAAQGKLKVTATVIPSGDDEDDAPDGDEDDEPDDDEDRPPERVDEDNPPETADRE